MNYCIMFLSLKVWLTFMHLLLLNSISLYGCTLFLHSPGDRHGACFCWSQRTLLLAFLGSFFWSGNRNETGGSSNRCVFNMMRKNKTFPLNGYTILHAHQQHKKLPIVHHHHQHTFWETPFSWSVYYSQCGCHRG